jgi:hypothetical protein
MKVFKNVIFGMWIILATLLTFVYLGDLSWRSMCKVRKLDINYKDAVYEICSQSLKDFRKFKNLFFSRFLHLL